MKATPNLMKNMEYMDKYLSVDLDFIAEMEKKCREGRIGKFHFYNAKNDIDQISGKLSQVIIIGFAEFALVNDYPIRLDKIIRGC